MGTITAQAIVDRVQLVLADTTAVRWTEDELLGWLNECQYQIVQVKPDSYTVLSTIQLTANTTKQSIPAGGIQFMRLVRNMGANGSTPGNAIRYVPTDILDRTRPDWHALAGANGVVLHYADDKRDKKNFYVYPAQPATGTYVEILYAAAPAPVAAIGNAITIDDIWSPAMVDYILARAYTKDADFAGNAQRAQWHWNNFLNMVGAKTQGEQANTTSAFPDWSNRAN